MYRKCQISMKDISYSNYLVVVKKQIKCSKVYVTVLFTNCVKNKINYSRTKQNKPNLSSKKERKSEENKSKNQNGIKVGLVCSPFYSLSSLSICLAPRWLLSAIRCSHLAELFANLHLCILSLFADLSSGGVCGVLLHDLIISICRTKSLGVQGFVSRLWRGLIIFLFG